MALKITSKKDGFRRCGVEHPDKAVVHPDGKFNPEQIRRLKAEPMLIVEEIFESGTGNTDNSGKNTLNPVKNLNAKDAIKQIENLSLDELKQVIATDERTTVRQAAAVRTIPELEKQLTEAQQLPDDPDKDNVINDLNEAINALRAINK